MDIEETGSNLQVSASLIMQISNSVSLTDPPSPKGRLSDTCSFFFFVLEYLKMSLFGTKF